MTIRAPRGGALLAAVLATLAVAGCSGGGTPAPRAGPDLAGFEEITSTANRLPPEFPRDLSLPKGYRVLYSAVSKLGVSVYFDTGGPSEGLKGFMLEELPDAGWALRSCRVIPRSPEPVTIITAVKDGSAATVTIGYHPDFAARLEGRHYDLFVAYAFRSQTPEASAASPC